MRAAVTLAVLLGAVACTVVHAQTDTDMEEVLREVEQINIQRAQEHDSIRLRMTPRLEGQKLRSQGATGSAAPLVKEAYCFNHPEDPVCDEDLVITTEASEIEQAVAKAEAELSEIERTEGPSPEIDATRELMSRDLEQAKAQQQEQGQVELSVRTYANPREVVAANAPNDDERSEPASTGSSVDLETATVLEQAIAEETEEQGERVAAEAEEGVAEEVTPSSEPEATEAAESKSEATGTSMPTGMPEPVSLPDTPVLSEEDLSLDQMIARLVEEERRAAVKGVTGSASPTTSQEDSKQAPPAEQQSDAAAQAVDVEAERAAEDEAAIESDTDQSDEEKQAVVERSAVLDKHTIKRIGEAIAALEEHKEGASELRSMIKGVCAEASVSSGQLVAALDAIDASIGDADEVAAFAEQVRERIEYQSGALRALVVLRKRLHDHAGRINRLFHTVHESNTRAIGDAVHLLRLVGSQLIDIAVPTPEAPASAFLEMAAQGRAQHELLMAEFSRLSDAQISEIYHAAVRMYNMPLKDWPRAQQEFEHERRLLTAAATRIDAVVAVKQSLVRDLRKMLRELSGELSSQLRRQIDALSAADLALARSCTRASSIVRKTSMQVSSLLKVASHAYNTKEAQMQEFGVVEE